MKSRLAQLNELVYRIGAYDRMAILMTLGLDNYLRRTYTEHIPKCSTIIDIGAGTGRNIPYIYDKGDKIICVDISFTALKTCLQKYRNREKIDIVCSSAESLPIKDRSVDVALSSYVLRHLNINRFIRELKRITHRGSRIVIVDFWKPEKTYKHLLLLLHLSILVTFLSFLTFPTLVTAYVGVWKNIPNLCPPQYITRILDNIGRVEAFSIVDIIYIWKVDVV